MRVVTTVHKEGWDQYGEAFFEGMKLWPDHELRIYAEGFKSPTGHQVEDLPKLVTFKERHKGYRANWWPWDVKRFANKVYTMHDASKDYDGLCVWVDADCLTYRLIPDGYIQSLLPDDCFLSYFRRKGMHSELGFWLMDGAHPEKMAFLDTWLSWYETDLFKDLRQWHDCETFDATVRLFLKRERFKVHSLSGEFEKHDHPMSQVDLARFCDHIKGRRKRLGRSLNNRFRDEVQPV